LNDKLMAVELTIAMQALRPHALFSIGPLVRNPGGGFGEPYYDLAPDGQSFLINRMVHDSSVEPITVVLGWASSLRK
jgi:hypothetical protein